MNDDLVPLSRSTDVRIDAAEDAVENKSVHDVTTTSLDHSSRASAEHAPDSKPANKNNPDGDSRSDSEAETVVPYGKDETATRTNRKAFKHDGETGSVSEADRNTSSDGVNDGKRKTIATVSSRKEDVIQEPNSNVLAETNNSSNLSSTTSSPAHEPRSPSINRSDSVHSRSSVYPEGTSPQSEVRSRKRKRYLPSNGSNGTRQQSPSKQQSGIGTKNTQELRGTHTVSRQEASADRSTSPMTRPQPCAQSSDLNASHRRKKPPPLLVSHHRRASEEPYAESDESGSVHTAVHLRRLVSVDTAAISPAKTPHKKLRDKNGRTQLARACAGEEVDHVKIRLQERPQDLDIADNAGNSPLQIAALEGNANIVEVLLEAGCDTTCKNIDSDTPLIDAVENGHLDVVKLLLKAGLDPRQSNAKGEEPLDLLDPNDDNYEEIKSALIEAKGNDSRRRHSEDQNGQPSAGRESISAQSPHGSPSLPSARSPPSHPPISRRRTARSEVTRNDLLWINPSPENLRDRAGKGDVEGVVYILDMCPTADMEAVLAAARGGHKVVLELLLAIGKPDPDPNPLQSSGYKAGYNTPMLAAIGRGNTGVITLLLSEPGFNPTRRLYKNLAYHEIAKERQGLDWEEEYNILKTAFDNYNSPNATNISTDQAHSGTLSREAKRPRRSTLTSALREPIKEKSLEPAVNEGRMKKGRPREGKGDATSQDQAHAERIQHSSRKHLQIPTNSSRDSSVAASDRESTTRASPTNLKTKRSSSDVGVDTRTDKQLHKPRRKLVSGKVFRNDQEKKRRVSTMSEASSSTSQNQDSIKVENITHIANVERDLLDDHTDAPRHESLKKRHHRSSSSPRDVDSRLRRTSDIPKKKKRRRIETESDVSRRESDMPPEPVSAVVANMISTTQSLDSSTPPQGAAPVAFMGNSNASPIASPTNTNLARTDTRSPATNIDQAAQRSNYLQDLRDQTHAEELLLRQERLDQELEQPAIQLPSQAQVLKENQERKQREQDMLERQAKEKAALDDMERESCIAREQEEALLEEQRKIEEAERNAKLEREAEEARIERKRKEEEMQKRRAEVERLQKEEQERRRAEKEEHERVVRLRRLEEEQRRRREALPNGLRRAAELQTEDARAFNEILKWLPLFTVTSQQLDPDCSEEVKDEKWISNVQAAPILAVTDLDLSQYTAWTKRPTTECHRLSLWRVLRCKLAQVERSPLLKFTLRADLAVDAETKEKYFAMKRVFWIKHSDFADIAASTPHLSNLELRSAPMALMSNHNLPNRQRPNGLHKVPSHDQHLPINGLTNGYH